MIKAKDAAEMVRTLDLVGAMVAIVLFLSSIITFGVRLSAGATAGRWTGIPFYLMTAPLVFLLFMAPRVNRSFLYYLQIALMLTAIVVLFLLDYVFQADWRDTRWIVVGFVTIYFAGLGGMIGVAALAGRAWSICAAVLFLVTLVLAFVQRAVTGL